MKQAARMQQQMDQVQSELAARTVEGTSGGGAVKVTARCDGTLSAVKIDPQSYSVFLGPHAIHVSRKEFELLYLMASRPGKIFNRNELYEQVWKKKYSFRDRTIDVHIRRLRKALEPSGHDRLIETVRGSGYRFSANPE